VVGSGTMGHQIALQCSFHNYNVNLIDVSNEVLKNAQEKIRTVLTDRVNGGEIPVHKMRETLSRVNYSLDLKKFAENADFVIETVNENLELKREVFRQLDIFSPPQTILSSNTSSLKPSLIAEVTKRPDKIIATNFENPVWETPMVEVMGSSQTSRETIEVTKQFLESISLSSILVKREITGFVLNRIWRGIKKESLFLVDQGYISFEDLDRGYMMFHNVSSGPFMIMDRIGLDVVKNIEETYYQESKDERDKPPKLLTDKVKKGELGVKTGKGFYKYPNPAFKKPGWLKGKVGSQEF
jgi:3-hydroxybutyryl-CoA dehydrogenase